MTLKDKAFRNWAHNKITLTFPNGNKLSTIWGYCTYSDNKDMNGTNSIDKFETFASSNTCEIMILKAPKKTIKKIHKKYNAEEDTVIGYVTMAQWLDIVKILSK